MAALRRGAGRLERYGVAAESLDRAAQIIFESRKLVGREPAEHAREDLRRHLPRTFELRFEAPAGVSDMTTDLVTPFEVAVLAGQDQVQGFRLMEVH